MKRVASSALLVLLVQLANPAATFASTITVHFEGFVNRISDQTEDPESAAANVLEIRVTGYAPRAQEEIRTGSVLTWSPEAARMCGFQTGGRRGELSEHRRQSDDVPPRARPRLAPGLAAFERLVALRSRAATPGRHLLGCLSGEWKEPAVLKLPSLVVQSLVFATVVSLPISASALSVTLSSAPSSYAVSKARAAYPSEVLESLHAVSTSSLARIIREEVVPLN